MICSFRTHRFWEQYFGLQSHVGASYNLDYQCYKYKHHFSSLIVIGSQYGDLLHRRIATENLTVLSTNGCCCHLLLSPATCCQCSDCVVYNSQYFVFAIIFKLVLRAYLTVFYLQVVTKCISRKTFITHIIKASHLYEWKTYIPIFIDI